MTRMYRVPPACSKKWKNLSRRLLQLLGYNDDDDDGGNLQLLLKLKGSAVFSSFRWAAIQTRIF